MLVSSNATKLLSTTASKNKTFLAEGDSLQDMFCLVGAIRIRRSLGSPYALARELPSSTVVLERLGVEAACNVAPQLDLTLLFASIWGG